MLAPESEPALPEFPDRGLGALLLAIRRQHGAGIEAAGESEGLRRALAQRNSVSTLGEQVRLPQSNDSGAADRYRFRFRFHRRIRFNLRLPGLRASYRRRLPGL